MTDLMNTERLILRGPEMRGCGNDCCVGGGLGRVTLAEPCAASLFAIRC